ncbi:MAG: Dna2/Cas4 domain-containing protein [bacterium]
MNETKMSMYVTSLSKLLAGEENCLFKIWYKMRNKIQDEISKELVLWKMNHTSMLNELIKTLKDGEIKREFWLGLDILNGNLRGSIDLLHIKDEMVEIHECKSGQERHSDQLQILIYLFMFKKMDSYKDKEIKGILHYNERDVHFNLNDIPDDLQILIEKQAEILLNDDPPNKYAGGSCKWCKIDCESKTN